MSASLKQWEQYYRTGALATGPVGSDGGYDLEVKALWQQFFIGMPRSARVLDVGTGNGVVPAIAVEVSEQNGLSLEIHAADLAQIQPMIDVPDAAVRLSGVHFHPGVACEALPMADASFAAVSGHYALEYSEVFPALTQIHRVLQPHGKALFVIHHRDSVLVKNALDTIQEGNFVVSEVKIYQRLRRLLSYHGDSSDTAMQLAEPLRAGIRELKAALQKASGTGLGQMCTIALDAVSKLMQMNQKIPLATLLQELDRAEQEMKDSIQRVKDLVAVAQNSTQVSRLQSTAKTVGFEDSNVRLLHHDSINLVGWVLELTKSGRTYCHRKRR